MDRAPHLRQAVQSIKALTGHAPTPARLATSTPSSAAGPPGVSVLDEEAGQSSRAASRASASVRSSSKRFWSSFPPLISRRLSLGFAADVPLDVARLLRDVPGILVASNHSAALAQIRLDVLLRQRPVVGRLQARRFVLYDRDGFLVGYVLDALNRAVRRRDGLPCVALFGTYGTP